MPPRSLELPAAIAEAWMVTTGMRRPDSAARKMANTFKRHGAPWTVVRLHASDLDWIRWLADDLGNKPPAAMAVAVQTFLDACALCPDAVAKPIAYWSHRRWDRARRWRYNVSARVSEAALFDLYRIQTAFDLESRGEALRLVVYVCRQLRGTPVAEPDDAPSELPPTVPDGQPGRSMRDLLIEIAEERGIKRL